MRTKQLLMATLALPLAFVACTSEELVEMNQPQVEMDNVVGAELIAQGVTVNLEEGVDSRYSGGFDETDRLGLAWWNNPADAMGTIGDTQGDDFDNQDESGKIYNNMLVKYDKKVDNFYVNGDIFKGAYFVYFPYQKLGEAKTLTVNYQGYEQNQNYTKDEVVNRYMENALHLSQKMILTSGDVDDNFNINIQTRPIVAVNPIAVLTDMTKEDAYGNYDESLVNTVEIKEIAVTVDDRTFYPTATVNQFNLPVAELKNGEVDKDKTAVEIQKAIYDGDALSKTNGSSTISTKVGYANKVSDTNVTMLYTFPAKAYAVADENDPNYTTSASIVITTNVGTFTYDQVGEENPNGEVVQKLLDYANDVRDTDLVDEDGEIIKYNFGEYTNMLAALSLELNMNELVLFKTITSAEQWNQLMPFYNAAGEDVTVELGDDITFNDEHPFTLPKNINVTVDAGSYDLIFDGAQKIEKDFTANVDVTVNGTLEISDGVKFIVGDVDNNGTITLGEGAAIEGFAASKVITNEKGIINCNGRITENMSVANTDGVINVVYDKSYVTHDKNGIIAGTLNGEDEAIKNDYVAAIYTMIPDNDNTAVRCNQLTLKNLKIKNGDKATQWYAKNYEINDNTFKEINLILDNSSLKSETQMNVMSIDAHNTTIEGPFNVTGDLKLGGDKINDEFQSVLKGEYTIGGDMELTMIQAEGEFDVTGNMVANWSELNGEFVMGGELEIQSSAIAGTYTVGTDAKLKEVTTAEGTVVNATGDMEIGSASTFTCTTLTAVDVEINGDAKTTFVGTNLKAATLTINNSELVLDHHAHPVGDHTEYIHSAINTTGKIFNENSGKVTKNCDQCIINENEPSEELKKDREAMQSYINFLLESGSYTFTNEKELAEQLNTNLPVVDYEDVNNKEWSSVKFVKLMIDYGVIENYTAALTEAEIKLFEVIIGQQIVFE